MAPFSHLCPSAAKVTSQFLRKLLSVTVRSNVNDILLSLTCRQSNVWHSHDTPGSHSYPFPEIYQLDRNTSWTQLQSEHHPEKTAEKNVQNIGKDTTL